MQRLTKLILCGSLLGLASAPALAGGPLNLNPADPDGVERWPNGGLDIPFNPDQGGIPGVMDVGTVTLATGAWEAIPSATNTYSNNGTLPFDVDATNFFPFIENLFFGTNNSDGLSPIVFDDDGSIFLTLFGPSGVLGFASTDTRDASGTPIEAVMFLNGGATVSGGGGYPDADFIGVTVHEFGHYSGLAHTVVNGENQAFGDETGPTPFNTYGNSPADQVETMYPFALIGGGQVTPHADDIGILSFLYPETDFFATSATISGQVLAPNGSTPLTGVNVIARNVANPFVDAVSAISGDRGDTGAFTINGLTPGAEYTVHIDQILAGGFSTPLILIPGPEEFYNGADESNNIVSPDDPGDAALVSAAAGGTAAGVDVIVNAPAPGDPLLVGDDGFVQLSLPFTFEICGQGFDSVFVNANGNLTFGSGSSDFTESSGEFLGNQPRIAALWDDLTPFLGGTQQGLVTYDVSPTDFIVIFDEIPEFPNIGANSFEITLSKSSDHVDLVYGDISATDGLAGVSCGGLVTSRFETPEDLSANGRKRLNLKNQPARWEQFGFSNENDLANSTVRFNGTTDYNDNWAESNDSLRKARRISLPFDSRDVVRFTEIEPVGGDVDYFRFGAEGGTTLLAEVRSGGMDSVMGLYDADGNLVALDDDGGSGLLSRIVYEIPADGDYFLAVSSFPDFDFSGDGGSGGRYVLEVFTINATVLSLGDDDTTEVPIGFTFPFQGDSYDTVWVNSNGNITFGSGDTDFSESVSEFLNEQPRIAPLWDDLSPNNGGLVLAGGDASSFTVAFVEVPEFFATGANSFVVTLTDTGEVSIAYGAISANDGLAGVTEGGGAADPGATDLSAGGPFPVIGTVYEIFGGVNPNDLSDETLDFE